MEMIAPIFEALTVVMLGVVGLLTAKAIYQAYRGIKQAMDRSAPPPRWVNEREERLEMYLKGKSKKRPQAY